LNDAKWLLALKTDSGGNRVMRIRIQRGHFFEKGISERRRQVVTGGNQLLAV